MQADAAAQFSLGDMNAKGEGGVKDLIEARRLFGLSAAQGYELAQARLALMTAAGEGGPRDAEEARRLFGIDESPEVRAAALAVADSAAAARAAGSKAAALRAAVEVREQRAR